MSVYLRQIVAMSSSDPDLWECCNCGREINDDEALFGDEGVCCNDCRDEVYPPVVDPDHDHDWKTYDSGWDKYDYCDCGAKRRD